MTKRAALRVGVVLSALGAFASCASERRHTVADAPDASAPFTTKASVERPATVVLPARANDAVRVEDDTSHLAVSFTLLGAEAHARTDADGVAVYPRAFRGGDVTHRVSAEGTEDFVAFDAKPIQESLQYAVDISRVAGLRLVASTLEFLDATGAPRLRVSPPYVIDATGERIAATLDVVGCAFDASAAAPWNRAVTPPGAKTCGVRVAWSDVAYPAIVDPSWTTTGSLVTARTSHTATLLANGRVLIAGGSHSGDLTSAELYDPTTGTFAVTGSMVTARTGHTATLLAGGTVLVHGATKSAESYNPATGLFSAAGTAAFIRYRQTATLLGNGKVLFAGGYNTSVTMAGSELLTPPSTWTTSNAMTVAREAHTATLLQNGKVLVTGGLDASAFPATYHASADVYDPTPSTFTATGGMGTARSRHTATLLANGKVLVAGGYSGSAYLATALLYDPALGTFAATGTMAAGRHAHTATLLGNGKVLVAGGFGGSVLSSAEVYDPTAGSWGTGGTMAVARDFATATLLSSGRVLVSSGGALANATAEVFNVLAGIACTVGTDCASGVCDGGYCCAAACASCQKCAAGTGACVNVTSADDPDTCTGVSTCNASGACKLKTSQACPGGATTCATGNCSDGFCCDQACGSACDVCAASLGASQNGTCTTAPVGYAGGPACGNGNACNGTSTSCPVGCASDVDCLAADYCATNGTCQPRKAQGATCAPSTDCKGGSCRVCTTGNCVDGVCCDTACTGSCMACAASLKQTGADGTCGPAKDNTNPHNDTCPVDPPSSCGHSGKCDGNGGCRIYYPPTTSCGASVCSGNKVTGLICNGAGICANNATGTDCAPYKCTGGACLTSCTSNADCDSGAFCNGTTCEVKRDNGQKCSAKEACTSNICVDGVCCNAPCGGQCEACDVPNGEGTCVPVSGAPRNRAACPGADAGDVCAAARCDGTERNSCTGFPGSGVQCRAPSCTNGVATLPAACTGSGTCAAPVAAPCNGYACGADACKTSCAIDGDCAAGYTCDTGTQKCVSGATCDGDHTTTGANGVTHDCAPFKCETNGTCKQLCTSVSDCVSPAVCDGTGACVAPAAPTGDSGGCSVGARGGSFGWIAIAIACVAARRRRHRSYDRSACPSPSSSAAT